MSIKINELSPLYTHGFDSVDDRINPSPSRQPARSYTLYGFHVNPNESDPSTAVTYLEDAVGKSPCQMGETTFDYGSWENAFFMPKPCMLKSDGTVDYYLNPDNYAQKADGTSSDIGNPNYDGNAMMEWPLIWFKFEPSGIDGEGDFYVANEQVDETFHCYCNYDWRGNIIDHFYMSIYRAVIRPVGSSSILRTMSGYPLIINKSGSGLSWSEEHNYVLANNQSEAEPIWEEALWCDRILVSALCVLLSKTLDSQSAFGNGYLVPTTGESQPGKSPGSAQLAGTLNDKGLFYGNTQNGNEHVKVFGIEDFWGFAPLRLMGAFYDTNISSTSYLTIKMTYGTQDGTSSSGWTSTGAYLPKFAVPTRQPSGSSFYEGWINKLSFSDFGFFPSDCGDDSTSYECDYYYHHTENDDDFLLVGAAYKSLAIGPEQDIKKSGLFCSYMGESDINITKPWYIGTMLSCKPVAST